MNFKDKTIVITGASSGIGYALAYEFASRGARIVMGARSEDKLRSIAEDLAARGTQAVYEPTDVTREEDCRRLVEKAVSSFGRIDVLICNAGISMRALFDEVDLGVLKRLMDVNFWGTVYCTKYALPYIQASRGSIVGVSSVAGFHGLPGRTAFSIYRFDDRDKAALAWLIFCGAYLISGWMAGGTYFRYYPTVKAAAWTPMTVSFMLVYLALVLTPVILDRKEDRQWKSLRSEI